MEARKKMWVTHSLSHTVPKEVEGSVETGQDQDVSQWSTKRLTVKTQMIMIDWHVIVKVLIEMTDSNSGLICILIEGTGWWYWQILDFRVYSVSNGVSTKLTVSCVYASFSILSRHNKNKRPIDMDNRHKLQIKYRITRTSTSSIVNIWSSRNAPHSPNRYQ
ncbi:unnamed protein product [Fusarium graminearum]|nr:unnamed protein product [Fusarium graminearum]